MINVLSQLVPKAGGVTVNMQFGPDWMSLPYRAAVQYAAACRPWCPCEHWCTMTEAWVWPVPHVEIIKQNHNQHPNHWYFHCVEFCGWLHFQKAYTQKGSPDHEMFATKFGTTKIQWLQSTTTCACTQTLKSLEYIIPVAVTKQTSTVCWFNPLSTKDKFFCYIGRSSFWSCLIQHRRIVPQVNYTSASTKI